jgi:hypothetical protein
VSLLTGTVFDGLPSASLAVASAASVEQSDKHYVSYTTYDREFDDTSLDTTTIDSRVVHLILHHQYLATALDTFLSGNATGIAVGAWHD